MKRQYKKKTCPKCHKRLSYYHFKQHHEPKCKGDPIENKVKKVIG